MANNISIIGASCTGCKTCAELCPSHAISMALNKEGFDYPMVNPIKCISCGLCLKKCAAVEPNSQIGLQTAYSGYIKDKNKLERSSSGGAFTALAESVLDDGGVVFGCAFNESHEAIHISASNSIDLEKLKGSKYVQSDIGLCHFEIKEFLEKGRKVLFTGTPCQVSALINFLHRDYDNLYTCDVICHGVPSKMLFQEHLKWIGEKNNGEVLSYQFRCKKKNGWSLTYETIIKKKNGHKKRIENIASLDPYYEAFLRGLTYRESCYKCIYSTPHRVGDITIGDFWGIESYKPEYANTNGVSAIIINSKQGRELCERVKDRMELYEVDYHELVKRNGNLHEPSQRPKERDLIYKSVISDGYDRTAKKYMRNPHLLTEIIRNLFTNKFRQNIKRMIRGNH